MIPGLWWVVPAENAKEAEAALPSDLNQPFLKRTLKRKVDLQLPAGSTAQPLPKASTPKAPANSKAPRSAKSKATATASTGTAHKPESKPWTLLHMRKPEDPGTHLILESANNHLLTRVTAQVRVANAPEWLLTACQSLDAISNEYPKTITVLAAVLITVGSVPSLPVAAGTALASGTAHAIGGVAVGLGSWINAQQRGMVHVS